MATPRYGTFVEPEYFDSKPYKILSGAQHRLLMGFLRRRRKDNKKWRKTDRYPVTNAREIVFTTKNMMAEVGTKRPGTVTAARDRLVELGFIDIVKSYNGRAVAPNIYGISNRYLKWDPDSEVRERNGFKEVTRRPDPRHNKFYRQRRNEKSSATENRSRATTENSSRKRITATEKSSRPIVSGNERIRLKRLPAKAS